MQYIHIPAVVYNCLTSWEPSGRRYFVSNFTGKLSLIGLPKPSPLLEAKIFVWICTNNKHHYNIRVMCDIKVCDKRLWRDVTNSVKAMTHTTRIRGVFDVANSLRYRTGFTPMLFQWSHSHMQCFLLRIHGDFFTVQFFCSRPFLSYNFFVQFCVATGLTTVCFTIYMIQHMFSILIYSFNHIFIKLP